jgi:hypothetical protein
MDWLPEPPPGTKVTLGFDGSDSDDWSALRGRTEQGYGFSPRHGDGEPTIWIPAEHGGRIPRTQVNEAVDALFERFTVVRFYYDPFGWATEGEAWALRHGENKVVAWATNRTRQMHEALVRYLTDLAQRVFTHDGCPLTSLAADNARKVPGRRNRRRRVGQGERSAGARLRHLTTTTPSRR